MNKRHKKCKKKTQIWPNFQKFIKIQFYNLKIKKYLINFISELMLIFDKLLD